MAYAVVIVVVLAMASSAIGGSVGADRGSCRAHDVAAAVARTSSIWGILHFHRGGASKASSSSQPDAYAQLARAMQSHIETDEGEIPDTDDLVRAFKMMSSSQKAFKGLDGAAHEAYQRTHSGDGGSVDDAIIGVAGRARRSLARAGAVADSLGSCELCELVEFPERFDSNLINSPNGTLAGREVLLNVTDGVKLGDTDLSVLVLYEPSYRGGVGVDHGGLVSDDITRPSAEGRLLIVLGDKASHKLERTIQTLVQSPLHVRLEQGFASSEVASVQPSLYKAAGSVLKLVEPIIRSHNASAIHFTGHSLAGGVAALASTMIDGRLPIPGEKKRRKSASKASRKKASTAGKDDLSSNTTSIVGEEGNATVIAPLQGLAKGRASAVTLGAPPCMSPNVQADFVTSLLYGDDIVGRASKEGIDRFISRARRALRSRGLVLRQMNWMTDTLSLAASNLKSHAHGSEGEEARLAVPGVAYLIRPRRLGGSCSMHEIGGQLKGGREALRAAVLWQLNDILLSRSMWKHHQLESYIQGLDHVHLRGFDKTDDEAPEGLY